MGRPPDRQSRRGRALVIVIVISMPVRAGAPATPAAPPSASLSLSGAPLFYLRAAQSLGLCPVSLNVDVRLSLPLAWSWLQLLSLSALHLIAGYFYCDIIYNADVAGQFNDTCRVCVLLATYTLSQGESIRCVDALREFFVIYASLQRSQCQTQFRDQFQLRRLHVYAVLLLAVMCSAELLLLLDKLPDRKRLLFFSTCVSSSVLNRLRVLLFIALLQLLRLQISSLHSRILALPKGFTAEHLRLLSAHYEQLARLSELLRAATGRSLLAIYVTSYIKLVADCYWLYWLLYQRQPLREGILSLVTALHIVLLLLSARDCERAAALLQHSVHGLRLAPEQVELTIRLQHFQLLLRLRPIYYDACGMFRVNCGLASAMLASLTTYMLFFVQFMPKFTRLFYNN